jgi:hypothetical protein
MHKSASEGFVDDHRGVDLRNGMAGA